MIPLFRPALDTADIQTALSHMRSAMQSGYIGEGPICAEFEAELARVLETATLPLYVNSCTSALRLAYHLAGAGPGKNVVCTPMTCLATATAILETGATIRWADIDPITGNIDPASAAAVCDRSTVAIAAVDWAGRVADFARLRRIGPAVPLVEDAAHAFGASGPARGDFVAYSFQAIKHVTTADGGALICPTSTSREKARMLRWFGLDRTKGASMRCLQTVEAPGFKMQGNDILAGLGLASLEGAGERLRHIRQIARIYHDALSGLPSVQLAPYDPNCSYWFFPILVEPGTVDQFVRHMASHGVEVGQVHARLDTQLALGGRAPYELRGLDSFAARQVNLPCGWHVKEPWTVIEAVKLWGKI